MLTSVSTAVTKRTATFTTDASASAAVIPRRADLSDLADVALPLRATVGLLLFDDECALSRRRVASIPVTINVNYSALML